MLTYKPIGKPRIVFLAVRNMLIVFALFSLVLALINFVTSVLLCVALRKVSLCLGSGIPQL